MWIRVRETARCSWCNARVPRGGMVLKPWDYLTSLRCVPCVERQPLKHRAPSPAYWERYLIAVSAALAARDSAP